MAKAKPLGRKGLRTPTFHYPAPEVAYDSLWDDPYYPKMVTQWGLKPLGWQEDVLRDCLAIDADFQALFSTVGLSVSRQNGKSEIIVILIFIYSIMMGYDITYTSYSSKSMKAIFKRVLEAIESNYKLREYFPADQRTTLRSSDYMIQAVDPYTGEKLGSCDFITRAGGGGRGATVDIIFFDEAQNLTDGENDAIAAATITLESGQLLYFGTPPPMDTSATAGAHRKDKNAAPAEFFKTMRASCKNGTAVDTCWIEWGADKLVPKTDQEMIYRTNPSLGYNLGPGQELTMKKLLGKVMSDERFCVEHMGYWMSQDKNRAIDISRWRGLRFTEDDGKTPKDYPMTKDTKIAGCFRFSHLNERLDFAVAFKTGDLPVCVEINESWDITKEWKHAATDLLILYLKNENCVGIAVDGAHAHTLLQQVQADNGGWSTRNSSRRQGKLLSVSATEMGAATADFISSVNEQSITHEEGDSLLIETAVEDAAKRISSGYSAPVGFRSMTGKVDVNYLEAAALALYMLRTDPSINARNQDEEIDFDYDFGDVELLDSTDLY